MDSKVSSCSSSTNRDKMKNVNRRLKELFGTSSPVYTDRVAKKYSQLFGSSSPINMEHLSEYECYKYVSTIDNRIKCTKSHLKGKRSETRYHIGVKKPKYDMDLVWNSLPPTPKRRTKTQTLQNLVKKPKIDDLAWDFFPPTPKKRTRTPTIKNSVKEPKIAMELIWDSLPPTPKSRIKTPTIENSVRKLKIDIELIWNSLSPTPKKRKLM